MGPRESTTEDIELAEMKKRHPDWDIHRVFGGWEAVPRGTPIVRAAYLETWMRSFSSSYWYRMLVAMLSAVLLVVVYKTVQRRLDERRAWRATVRALGL